MKKVLFSILGSLICSLVSYGQQDYVPSVIKIYDESEIDALIENGVEISRRRGDILLCLIPSDGNDDIIITNSYVPDAGKRYYRAPDKRYELISFPEERPDLSLKNFKNISFITPTLDKAVGFYQAEDIQNGQAFKDAFTGKGVVVGICDSGFDPSHPTFYNASGETRIKKITHYEEFEGKRTEMTSEEEYLNWVTDTYDDYHATHVAGIMAGGGAETSFKGIARDSDIVMSLSSLSAYGLLMGVEDIIDYAKEVGKPAVINLSMGNYLGAHDGSSLFSQYLDMCADEAIIVLSAGNEGNNNVSLTKKFSSDSNMLHFCLGNRRWNQKEMYGVTDIWNSTDRPLKVSICIYDDESHSVIYQYEALELTDMDYVIYEWNPEEPLLDGLSLDGFLQVIGWIDPENGRYNVSLIYSYTSSRLIGTGWAKDLISVKIEGEEGEDVEVFADGTYTRLMGISGEVQPGSEISISDLACGFRVVSVGMYGNRESYPATVFNDAHNFIGQKTVETGYTPGATVIYSSYGTLRDGRVMPKTVAPGMPLMSAMSAPFAEKYFGADDILLRNDCYWSSQGGTSMASPYVAGYIACWIEAIPDLTIEDVIKVIEETNRHDIGSPEDPRNISGYFDPVRCLRNLINENGINNISDPESILLPEDHVEIYNLSGARIYSGQAAGCNNLPKGMYIVKTPFGSMKHILPGLSF